LERTKRVDAEFYQKENLSIDELLKRLRHESIANVAYVSDGNHFAISDSFQDDGVPYYRGQDITNQFFVEQSAPIFIDEETFNEKHMIRSHLKKNDVLLSIVGTVGSVALFSQEINATCSCKIAILRPKRIVPEYFAIFLSSKFGQNQIKKFVRGAVQTGFLLEDTDQINVVLSSNDFQREIENLVRQAHAKLEESKALYSEAENLLLDELNLRSFTPSKENTSVKSFRESFLHTGRLDAEYYHPEKGSMLDWLARFQGESIGFYASLIDERIDPYQGFSSEPVNNFDLTDALEIYLDDRQTIPVYELGSTKKVMKRSDVVISRLRSYLKEIAIVDTHEELKTVGSSEFIVLRLNDKAINAETLLVYLRSLPVQQILKWCQSGSNHPRFMEEDLLVIKLPDKVLALQKTIQLNVREAITRSRESKRLLETAKRAVEIAIEEDEQAALAFIKSD
jgi:restriction endonuclease S subunit